MAWRLATAAQNAAGDGLVDLLDSGGTATIQVRTGSQPAAANDAASGTLLADLAVDADSELLRDVQSLPQPSWIPPPPWIGLGVPPVLAWMQYQARAEI